MYGICRRNEDELKKIGEAFGIENRFTDYQEVLNDPAVDFVHINSPIPDHGWMSIDALKAGKNVMCTVPMATTIEECEEIVNLVNETGFSRILYIYEFTWPAFIYITSVDYDSSCDNRTWNG